MFYWRIDLTQGQIYTFSSATDKIISAMPDGIEILAFISQDLPPQFVNAKNQLEDKLKEYDRLSGGKIKISYIDPIKNSDYESLAQSFGIPPLDLQVVENDQVQIKKAYFGLALVKNKSDQSASSDQSNPLDEYEKYEVIPVVENINNFEYDIASKLLKVGSDQLPIIGFLTGHGEHSLMPPSQYANMATSDPRMDYPLREDLSANYEIKTVDLGEYIKSTEENKTNPLDGISTLIVAGPQQEIPEEQATIINDFIKNGGNAVMLIDQYDINTQYGLIATPINYDFQNILKPLGVAINKSIIADNNSGTATFNQGFISYSIPYPYFIKVTDLNRDNSITQDLESFILPWASPIDYDSSDTSIIPLGVSSQVFTLMKEKEVSAPAAPSTETDTTEGQPTSEQTELKLEPISLDPEQDFGFTGTRKDPVTMAVMVERENQGKVVVIGDSDFVVQGGGNTTFFLNIVDSLSLGEDLIQIRSKGITDRPLKDVSDTGKNSIRWGLTIGVPILFILYGFYRRSIRNAMKKRI